jgi:hypothetical protein
LVLSRSCGFGLNITHKTILPKVLARKFRLAQGFSDKKFGGGAWKTVQGGSLSDHGSAGFNQQKTTFAGKILHCDAL